MKWHLFNRYLFVFILSCVCLACGQKNQQTSDEPHKRGVEETQKAVAEQQAWNHADTIGTVEAYQGYLKEYPEGRYVSMAATALADLAADAKEDQLWTETTRENTVTAFQAYRGQYPEGKYVTASHKLEETKVWESALHSNNKRVYQQYLSDYPQGVYKPLADKKLKAIAEIEKAQQMERRKREGLLLHYTLESVDNIGRNHNDRSSRDYDAHNLVGDCVRSVSGFRKGSRAILFNENRGDCSPDDEPTVLEGPELGDHYSETFSLSTWIRLDSDIWGNGSSWVMGQTDGDDDYLDGAEWGFLYIGRHRDEETEETYGRPGAMNFFIPKGKTPLNIAAKKTIAMGQWEFYTVVVKRIGSSTSVRLYRNGKLENESTFKAVYQNTKRHPFLIANGARHTNYMHLRGKLDDIRVYERALTEQEVKALYAEKNN